MLLNYRLSVALHVIDHLNWKNVFLFCSEAVLKHFVSLHFPLPSNDSNNHVSIFEKNFVRLLIRIAWRSSRVGLFFLCKFTFAKWRRRTKYNIYGFWVNHHRYRNERWTFYVSHSHPLVLFSYTPLTLPSLLSLSVSAFLILRFSPLSLEWTGIWYSTFAMYIFLFVSFHSFIIVSPMFDHCFDDDDDDDDHVIFSVCITHAADTGHLRFMCTRVRLRISMRIS